MKKNSLLWEINHPDFAGTSYLFGTMHVQDQCAFQFNDIILKIMDKCTAFATEFNLDEAASGMPMSYLQLPNKHTYQDYLTDKQLKKLEHILQKQVGISIHPYIQMKPLFLIQIITTLLMNKDKQYSLDEYLFRTAKQKDRVLLGLESYEEQLVTLQCLPLPVQFKSLVDMSKNFKQFRQQIRKTTSSYASGDLKKIFKMAKKGSKGMRKVLLYDRNIVMTNRFMEMGKDYTLLAAIGAGHLSGKKGVLRLLKQKGCQVQSVKI